MCEEGAAVSKHQLKIVWTPVGQREICSADIVNVDGVPRLIHKKLLLSHQDSSAHVRLETQDLLPPDDRELIVTGYWGDEKDAFHHSQTCGSGEAERLADFSSRCPGVLGSDDPVADRTGTFIAL